MAKKEKIVTDPFGSYTGLVKHPEEKAGAGRGRSMGNEGSGGKPAA